MTNEKELMRVLILVGYCQVAQPYPNFARAAEVCLDDKRRTGRLK